MCGSVVRNEQRGLRFVAMARVAMVWRWWQRWLWCGGGGEGG